MFGKRKKEQQIAGDNEVSALRRAAIFETLLLWVAGLGSACHGAGGRARYSYSM